MFNIKTQFIVHEELNHMFSHHMILKVEGDKRKRGYKPIIYKLFM